MPIVKATAAAATEFLTLCNPSKGILIFFIKIFFLIWNLTNKSKSVYSIFCIIFFI